MKLLLESPAISLETFRASFVCRAFSVDSISISLFPFFSRGIAISSVVVRGDCFCLFLGQHLNGRSRELDMTQYRREIQRSLLSHVKTVHLSGLLVFIYLFLEHFIYASIVWLFSVFLFFCETAFSMCDSWRTFLSHEFPSTDCLRPLVWHYGFGFLVS